MARLNDLIHQPIRLRIMSALTALQRDARLDFTYLRQVLELTDGNLGSHLHKLEAAGYVRLSKTFVNRKPRTFVEATGTGLDAFADHITALEEVLRGPSPPDKLAG